MRFPRQTARYILLILTAVCLQTWFVHNFLVTIATDHGGGQPPKQLYRHAAELSGDIRNSISQLRRNVEAMAIARQGFRSQVSRLGRRTKILDNYADHGFLVEHLDAVQLASQQVRQVAARIQTIVDVRLGGVDQPHESASSEPSPLIAPRNHLPLVCPGFPGWAPQNHSDFLSQHQSTPGKILISLSAHEPARYVRSWVTEILAHAEDSTLLVLHLNQRTDYPSSPRRDPDFDWLWFHPRVVVNCRREFVAKLSGSVFAAHHANMVWFQRTLGPHFTVPPTHVAFAGSSAWPVRSGFEAYIRAHNISALDLECEKKYHRSTLVERTDNDHYGFPRRVREVKDDPFEEALMDGSLHPHNTPSPLKVVVYSQLDGSFYPFHIVATLTQELERSQNWVEHVSNSGLLWEHVVYPTWALNYFTCNYPEQKLCPSTHLPVNFNIRAYGTQSLDEEEMHRKRAEQANRGDPTKQTPPKKRKRKPNNRKDEDGNVIEETAPPVRLVRPSRRLYKPEKEADTCAFGVCGFVGDNVGRIKNTRAGMYPNIFFVKLEGKTKEIVKHREHEQHQFTVEEIRKGWS